MFYLEASKITSKEGMHVNTMYGVPIYDPVYYFCSYLQLYHTSY